MDYFFRGVVGADCSPFLANNHPMKAIIELETRADVKKAFDLGFKVYARFSTPTPNTLTGIYGNEKPVYGLSGRTDGVQDSVLENDEFNKARWSVEIESFFEFEKLMK